MGNDKMKINEKYEVIRAEYFDGSYKKEEMTLIEITEFRGKEIYIFLDSNNHKFVSYNHGGKPGWGFIEDINVEFGD